MNAKKLLCFAVAAVVSTPVIASAQLVNLADAAKAEKARRAKIRAASGPAKVYTESDRTGVTPDDPTAAADPAAAAQGGAPAAAGAKKKEKTPEELAAEKQKEWTEKVQKVNDEIKATEATIATNERNLASTYNITPARQALVDSVAADKKKVESLRQQLASFEDERRRAGMARVR